VWGQAFLLNDFRATRLVTEKRATVGMATGMSYLLAGPMPGGCSPEPWAFFKIYPRITPQCELKE
jgi:hypothetical protein